MKQQNPLIILSNQGGGKADIVLDYAKLAKVAKILEAINHKMRSRILEHLDDLDDLATLENIAARMKLDETIVKKHLKILARYQVVTPTKNSSSLLVYLKNNDTLAKIKKATHNLSSE